MKLSWLSSYLLFIGYCNTKITNNGRNDFSKGNVDFYMEELKFIMDREKEDYKAANN